MKRLVMALSLAATLILVPGAPDAQAIVRPVDDLGCTIDRLYVTNNPGGGYSVIIRERCNGFSAVCISRFDANGNQIGQTECSFVYGV